MGARGEATISAGENEVAVLFTNRAIAEVEQVLGRSIVGVMQDYTSNNAGMRELVHLLRAGMQAARRDAGGGKRPVDLDDVYAVLDAAGYGACLAAVMTAVAAVLAHGTDQGDRKNQ